MGIFGRLLGRRRTDKRALDLATIAAVARAGADLNVPRETRHYLYFANEQTAGEAGQALARPFREVTVDRAPKGSKWLVLVVQQLAVNIETVTELRREFEAATDVPGADYDGWEAAIHEKLQRGT
jgi:hypothetical protein